MLILYTKDNCQYCEKVKAAFLEMGTVYEDRNIREKIFLDEARAAGAHTMPFLVDTFVNKGVGDSDEIIAYVKEGSF